MSDYTFKIDKEVLRDFFIQPQFTSLHKREVDKVLNVVLIKHYNKYYYLFEELKQFAWTAVLERKMRKDYDPTRDPYNYIYTTFRNEVGNNIIKLTREINIEGMVNFKEAMVNSSEGSLPSEVCRYQKYLTGEVAFTSLRIPKKDVLPLLVFLRLYEKRREVKVPSFITNSRLSIPVLYKLLKEIFEDNE